MATPHCIDWNYPGKNVPTWDPFLGVTAEELKRDEWGPANRRRFDAMLGGKIARGEHIEPTGLDSDPRKPPRAAPSVSILALLQDAAARYPREIEAEHQKMLAEWRALKTTWAGRAKAGPEPTLEDARKRRAQRLNPEVPFYKMIFHYNPGGGSYFGLPLTPGTWREWELLEIWREEARLRAIDEAEARADAYMKSLYPRWGGGT